MAFEGRSAGWFGCSQGIWSKTPGTQVQHRLIEAAARRRNGGNTGFSRAPPSAVSPTFHNLPGVFDHVPLGGGRCHRRRPAVAGGTPPAPAPRGAGGPRVPPVDPPTQRERPAG